MARETLLVLLGSEADRPQAQEGEEVKLVIKLLCVLILGTVVFMVLAQVKLAFDAFGGGR